MASKKAALLSPRGIIFGSVRSVGWVSPEFETSPNAGRKSDWRTPERALDISPLWIISFWVQLALLSDKCVLNITVTEGKFPCECVDYKFYCKPCLAFQGILSDPTLTAFLHFSAVLF